MPLLTLIAIASLVVSPGTTIDPLTLAIDGSVQCYQPDTIRKICRSIASYQHLDGTRYSNTAIVLIAPTGPLTLETTTIVDVRKGAVCGSIKANELALGKLRSGDRIFSPDEAAPVLAKIAQAMSAIVDKEICTSYQAAGTGFIAKATIDGIYRPDIDQVVDWVKPDAGYSVSP